MKHPDTGEYIIVGTTEEVRELKRKFDLWKDEKWTVFDIDLDKKVDQWFDSFANIAKKAKMYVDEDDVEGGSIGLISDMEKEGDIIAFTFQAEAIWHEPIRFISDLMEKIAPACKICCKGEPFTFFPDIGDDRTSNLQFFYVTNDKRYLE